MGRPFCIQKFVDNAQQCFAFTPQANFPAQILIFTEGEGDVIESRLPIIFFYTLKEILTESSGPGE